MIEHLDSARLRSSLRDVAPSSVSDTLLSDLSVAAAAARPLVIAVIVSASLSMAIPLGYQTSLVVYAPGGYRFTDFTRAGLLLQLLAGTLAVALIPMMWPLGR